MSGRPVPQAVQATQQRNKRSLSQVRNAQMNGPRSNDKVLASLRATQVVASKPVLPAELLAMILDYLPVPDLMQCARVSRRLQEMVYDDTRWIQKLKAIGVWNEAEARQRIEDAMKRKVEAQRAREADEAKRTGVNLPGSVNGIAGGGRQHAGSVTLFDAGAEESKYRRSLEKPAIQTPIRRGTLADGFDDLTISPSSPGQASVKPWDPSIALRVLSEARSIRGRARQEFGKIYGALGPLHMNLARSKSHSDAVIFRTYRDPEQQAQILSSLKQFAQCDSALGWQEREQKLDSMIGVFENAVLREFEQGISANDVDGRMRRYAHVLVSLNGGNAGVDAFITKNPLMTRDGRMGNPLACLEAVAPGHVDLNPSRQMFERLAVMTVEQAAVIDRVFPSSVDVLTPLLSRLCEVMLSEYLTTLFDEAHSVGIETYVKAVSGTFEQALRFLASLKPTKASPADMPDKAKAMVTQCYEKHIDLYLAEELAVFTTKSGASVSHWEKELSEQEASTESYFMSNINRSAAKRDFLSSFKKVVMMPVNVLPAFSAAKPTAVTKSSANLNGAEASYSGGRPRSPSLTTGSNTPQRPGTPQAEAPTTELAAKAAIMNSRLEGIKSLFSIEVALDLTHLAKACIERAAIMVRMGGHYGDEAKEQCEAIFVTLLKVLGDRHIRNGFDKAIGHLGTYNPREVRQLKSKGSANGGTTVSNATGVEPLVTFLELVNVGDLIQQMVDVFYAQEMIATKLTDRDDFLDPAVKEKKKFEQMLDERVAAGLNRGIDVLMDEVEYICATTQLPTDFNPGGTTGASNGMSSMVDIGASDTAKQIVSMISGHTGMLTGTTDKNMLDVFVQEVGLRLFATLCKHFKRQRISVDGAMKLISDVNLYSDFVSSLRQKPLLPYFHALREMSQIYLVHIDPPAAYFSTNPKVKRASLLSTKSSPTALQAKELATIIADTQRYHGIFGAEEVYEFAERRADWYLVKGDVERAMYGVGCSIM
ncbi:F-box protein: endocytic membrane traffic, recycling ReCYcling 1 [Saxophila tyrrhenica]|uniref:F-box protein: endocytic membrane traffic, recycling ReCYcling 1 n=1 Tax=Saxophila tyrrhenica TaxID=1690608 RepID=A0AAV9PIZ2_9PEZI|nr:F-box protein: endocytic membrane traffic, recycling ReCYcling 1 [Saxophila tyrrhenica]